MALQGTGSTVNGWSRPFYLTGANNYPITLSAWIKIPAASTAAVGFFGLCGANAMAFVDFYGSALTGGLNDLILDLYDDTGLGASFGLPGRSVVFTSDGNWHHIGAQIITNVSPPPGGQGGLFWVDGVRVGDTHFGFNFGAQTFNTLQIGVAPTDGSEPPFPTNTALAEVCVFANGPTAPVMDATMQALAQGVNPLRTPGNKSLKAYHPLRNNFQDFGSQRVGFAPLGTPVAPVWVSHPPVDPPLVAFRRLPATHVSASLASGGSTTIFGAGSVVDPGGNTWTIVSGQALQNGVAPAFSANIIALTLVDGVIWIVNGSSQYYAWLGGAWTAQFGSFPLSIDQPTAVLSSSSTMVGTGASSDSATGVLLASSLQGRTQVSTDTGIGFLASQTHFIGTSSSIQSGLAAISGSAIPMGSGPAISTDNAVGSLTVPSIAANTQQLQNALVDSLMRGQPFMAPATWFVALVTQLGDTISPGVEVSGGGYARAVISASLTAWSGTQGPSTTQASSGISGMVSNNMPITFPTATAGWLTVVGYEFWDQPSGGNRWISGKLGSALTVNNGDTRQFPIASLSIAIG